jgi:hypothetical protein
LLNSSNVEYLVIGDYAVNYYGFSRTTGDLDVWIAISPDNAKRVAQALHDFGFPQADAAEFQRPRLVVRMGIPPLRLEILTSISGVEFADCYARRLEAELGGITVNFIRLDDLKRNKRASGRLKDQLDLEQLP